MTKATYLPALILVAFTPVLLPQTKQDNVANGTIDHIKVHGKLLEGNLEGDSPDRDVFVYLPPGYKANPSRRYPVIYMLHGFTDSAGKWFGETKHWINLPSVLDQAFANPAAHEMIVVMPDAFTRFAGSMYSNSVTTGDWEDYVAKELVSYIDAHYRTIPDVASRGLSGHSMGGYGTMRIGMKHPEVFSSIYLLSPCCMTPPLDWKSRPEMMKRLEAIHTFDEVAKADFFTKAMFASAAAWSPNPKNPPFFVDLPVHNGETQPMVLAKWAANAPLAMIDQYIGNIRRLRAIAFDAGDKDAQIAATIKDLDKDLNGYDIAHTFSIYEGNHLSGVAERIRTKVIPFFSTNLSFDQRGR